MCPCNGSRVQLPKVEGQRLRHLKKVLFRNAIFFRLEICANNCAKNSESKVLNSESRNKTFKTQKKIFNGFFSKKFQKFQKFQQKNVFHISKESFHPKQQKLEKTKKKKNPRKKFPAKRLQIFWPGAHCCSLCTQTHPSTDHEFAYPSRTTISSQQNHQQQQQQFLKATTTTQI